jgi:hypothetical protein
LGELREQLAREIALRVALAREVASLRLQLSASVDGAAPLALREEAVAAVERGPASDAQPAPATPQLDGAWIDEGLLLEAGFAAREVADLRRHFESVELERLFIRHQASREGWIKEPRFRREMFRLAAGAEELREEYGDDAYDWILYASGRENRVVATAVIQDSPAERAALEAGDVVLAYGGQRILRLHDLRNATFNAEVGESMALDVERDGEARRFYVPAGPLGIRLKAVKQVPDHPR